MNKVGRTMMKAIRVREFGGPEVLKVDSSVPIPQPKENQILIRVHAAGVNPVDTYIRSGTYALKPPLPYIPGNDCAGMVEAVGTGIKNFKAGDRVFTIRTMSGAYAEYTLAEENFAGHLDDHLTFEQGAGVGIPYFTAYRAVLLRGNGKAGETILVHGASGAVGLACVQIACAHGMRVIGTAGTEKGMELIKKNGASCVYNHREEDYMEKILEETGGEGPDLVIEMLANVNLEKDFKVVKKRGRIVIVGSRGAIEITPRSFMAKEINVTGLQLMESPQEDWKQMHAGIEAGMKTGWVQPYVAKEYSLDQASVVHSDIINSSGALGKLIIKL